MPLPFFSIHQRTQGKCNPAKTLLATPLIAIAYGTCIKALQAIATPHRHPTLSNILANTAGALLGTALLKSPFTRKTLAKPYIIHHTYICNHQKAAQCNPKKTQKPT